MRLILLLLLLSNLILAQEIDTINLKEVSIIDYSKYKQFRPKYKSVIPHLISTKEEIILFSNFQLPKQDEVEIVAIEFLFNSKRGKRMVCNDSYFFLPKIVKEDNPAINLVEDKWFEVEKNYKGKFIFPVQIKIKSTEINDYLLGVQTIQDESSCEEKYSYFDTLRVKETSNQYIYLIEKKLKLPTSNNSKNESLNYIIYYK